MRKRLLAALGAATIAVLAVPVTVLGVHVTHPRAEDDFLTHLKLYGDPTSDQPVPHLPPRADLIAEGDVACAWLREQPYALWRTDARYRDPALQQRHEARIAGRQPSWGTAVPTLSSVASAAWAHLCPADVELRQPRKRPWAPPPD